MKRPILFFLCLICFIFLLNACSYMNSKKTKRTPYCNELNSQIVFGGATMIDREADIQTAESLLNQHTYDKDCIEP